MRIRKKSWEEKELSTNGHIVHNAEEYKGNGKNISAMTILYTPRSDAERASLYLRTRLSILTSILSA